MAEIRANFLAGLLTSNLTNVATTLASAQLANLPAVVSPNFARITLDPLGLFGNPEIIHVTAHTASATSATIARGQEGTSARSHTAANFTSVTTTPAWRHAPTAADFSSFDLNVDDFGAVGDTTGAHSNGTDDTVAIQAAMTAAAGKVLRFTPGKKYRITSAVFPTAGTTLSMWGATLVIDNTASDVRGICVGAGVSNTGPGVDDVSIYGATITGLQTTTRGHAGIAYLNGSNRGRVQFCHISGCGQYGIVVGDTGVNSGAAGHQILDNYIDMSAGVGVTDAIGIEVFPKGGAGYLADPGILIRGNTVVMGAATIEGGIKINAQRGARITNNYVSGGGALTGFAGCIIAISSSGVTIADNQMYNTRFGIDVSGTAGIDNGVNLQDVTIANNTIVSINITGGSTAAGIYSANGLSTLTIDNNMIDVGAGNTATACIFLQPANSGIQYSTLRITNNTCIRGTEGIYVISDVGTGLINAPYAVVDDNTCLLQGATGLWAEGPDISACGNKVVLAGTTSFKIAGARAHAEGNFICDGNTTNAASQIGIWLVGASTAAVGNSIVNATGGHIKDGIVFASGTGMVSGNHFVGMETSNVSGTVNHAGFFGAAQFAKPTITGSRGGNAALASLLTNLATAGLIIDGSS